MTDRKRPLSSSFHGTTSTKKRERDRDDRRNEQENVITPYDYEQLQMYYQFVLNSDGDKKHASSPPDAILSTPTTNPANETHEIQHQTDTTTWQQRMVRSYHDHLYKSHVLADFTRIVHPTSAKSTCRTSQIGLRWRTLEEVQSGMGYETCGNKHCPCYDPKTYKNYMQSSNREKMIQDIIAWTKSQENRQALRIYYKKSQDFSTVQASSEQQLINTSEDEREEKDEDEAEYEYQLLMQFIPHGIGLCDYQVHFAYQEHGQQKNELVKLRLCLQCAPMLFWNQSKTKKKKTRGILDAKYARQQYFLSCQNDIDRRDAWRKKNEEKK